MKKVILLFSIVISAQAYSQQDPIFSSEGFTPFYTNPASFGSWNVLSVNTVGRLQWNLLDEPVKSMQINLEAAAIASSRRKGAKELRLGLGVSFVAIDFFGSKTQAMKFPISIPIKLGETNLAFGVAPGFIRRKFSFTSIPPQTIPDSLVPPYTEETLFDMDAGLFWYGEKHFVGVSVSHIYTAPPKKINFTTARHYYLQTGYRFDVGEHHIFPAAGIKADGAGFLADVMCTFQFREDVFSIGAGYRFGAAFLLAASVKWKRIRLAYNFDGFPNVLSNGIHTAHEIRLSYIFSKSDRKLATLDSE